MIVPLVHGAGDRARALIAAGPPVDPAAWAIEEQQVFVTDSEIAFVFETADGGILERLGSGPTLWATRSEWREIAAGTPHVALAGYSWSRPEDEKTGLAFKPTPGPGYSEGGDVFAGIPLFSPHDLRHRRISLLHLRGMPWARIGEQVGSATWPSPRTSTRTYSPTRGSWTTPGCSRERCSRARRSWIVEGQERPLGQRAGMSPDWAQLVEGRDLRAQRRASSNRGSSRTAAKSSSLRASSRNRGSSSTDRRRWENVSSPVSPASVAKHA
jgi:hypothetical protein